MSNGLVMTGRTDTGMVREHNEDSFQIAPEIGLAILADGMGGHLAGEVASAMAVDQVTSYLLPVLRKKSKSSRKQDGGESPESTALVEAVQTANSAIHNASVTKPEQAGMGTTIVVAAFHDNLMTVAHVGDSRLYRYRQGALSQVTQDHSMVQELLRRGLISAEEARTSANRNLVTRALGVEPVVQVDVAEHPFEEGDIYLLCSDGLNDVLDDGDIAAMLGQYSQDLETATQEMITEVNARGGPDNVSIVLIRTDGHFKPQPDG